MKPIVTTSMNEMKNLGERLALYKDKIKRIERVIKLRQQGRTYPQIQQEMGISKMTVWRWLQMGK